jgi:CxxC motif-containing protein (DUF1111 family)
MKTAAVAVAIGALMVLGTLNLEAQFRAKDPGVRGGAAGAGTPLGGPCPAAGGNGTLTAEECEMFNVGLEDFAEEEEVDEGIGPRFNFVSCAGCHSQPAVGGSSPAVNPLFRVTGDLRFTGNRIPSFIHPNGPIREARFKFNADGSRDGGVHALFVITGHPDAGGCGIRQEDFESQVRNNNVVFRIPTPTFGTGLIEQMTEKTLLDNLAADSNTKRNLGISGRLNRNGNDGMPTKFGHKAQNVSLLIFSAEAYNVEMGITSQGFPVERDETRSCQFGTVPNDTVENVNTIGAIDNFANFQRFLAPPTPASNGYQTASGNVSKFSIDRGRDLFAQVGCHLCHTPTLRTNPLSTNSALRDKPANLYSDLALHAMGPDLADDILQGLARGDEFRTAPLWGLGKRIFFLHDGRTSDLIEAIREHKSDGNSRFGPSEANAVIDRFNRLGDGDKQHLVNFLRSL